MNQKARYLFTHISKIERIIADESKTWEVEPKNLDTQDPWCIIHLKANCLGELALNPLIEYCNRKELGLTIKAEYHHCQTGLAIEINFNK